MTGRWRCVIGMVILVASLGACGDAADELPPPADAEKGQVVDTGQFLKALEKSFTAGSTASVAFVVRGPVTLRGRGVVKYAKKHMDVDLTLDDWKVEGGTINLRTVRNTTYMKAPESRGVWVDVSSGKGNVPGAGVADEADPRRQIRNLRKTIDEVRFTGDDAVGDTRTRRYQVVTRPKDASSSGRDVTDYWFDTSSRVVRRSSELSGGAEATFAWTDWGKPVRIVAPKKGSIITFDELEKLQKQQNR